MKEKLINHMKMIYKDFEIDDETFKELYDNAMTEIIVNNSLNIEYQCYLQFRKYIDDYIMKKIQDGDELYQIYLASNKQKIVQRYLNIKQMNLNVETVDSKYLKNDSKNRLIKYYEDISDMVVANLKENYDYSSTLDEQYVKELRKQFNK